MEATITIKLGNETANPIEIDLNLDDHLANYIKARMIADEPEIDADGLDAVTEEAALVDLIDKCPVYFADAFTSLFEGLIAKNYDAAGARIELRDGIRGETCVGLFGTKNTFVVDADDADQFAADLCAKLDWPADCIDDLRETDEGAHHRT
ncbi:hypothetical protein [Pinisolibacter sp.]|uniref:hypothetical protein n=1 Tax=Pinisolibacter sp. TaxID=2172024 RepID=UPI002FDCE6D8